jgi:hypothetical protein
MGSGFERPESFLCLIKKPEKTESHFLTGANFGRTAGQHVSQKG